MAVNDNQKVDFIWKKIIYGVTETDIIGKDGSNEAIPSPLPLYASNVWRQDSSIPVPAPLTTTSVVERHYESAAIMCVPDPTVANDKTWQAVIDPMDDPQDQTNQYKWFIPPTFDPSYLVRVYAGDPLNGGVQLNGLTQGEEWIFDYVAGVLHFPNTVPSLALTDGIWLEAFRYIGLFGIGGGSGSIDVYDEGNLIGTYTEFNFIGSDVMALDSGQLNRVNIYIPSPTFLSHWNTNDGSNGDQSVIEDINRVVARISTPSGGEGNPFATGGWDGQNQDSSIDNIVTFTTSAETTGFGGNSTVIVQVFGYNSVETPILLETTTTTPIISDGQYGSTNIIINISQFGADSIRYKAKMDVSVNIDQIFSNNSQAGGRYYVVITHNTDSTTDGTGPHVYQSDDVFYDINPTTPSINSSVGIIETVSNIITKHLSGIEYYTLGSSFTVSVNDIDQHNRNTSRINSSLMLRGSEYGLPDLNESPFGTGSDKFIGWSNEENINDVNYLRDDWNISQTNYRYAGPSGNITAQARDSWNNGNIVASPDALILVDTYGITSTGMTEQFNDENRRLLADYMTPWDSESELNSGEAQIFNGHLIVPNQSTLIRQDGPQTLNADWTAYKPNFGGANPDYSLLSVPADYYRLFSDGNTTSDRASLQIVFTGTFNVDATTDLANNDLQIFIRKVDGVGSAVGRLSTAFLELHGPTFNFATFDDGVSDGHIRESSSSSNTVNGTFGPYPMRGGIYVQIRINNPIIKINSMTMTFF